MRSLALFGEFLARRSALFLRWAKRGWHEERQGHEEAQKIRRLTTNRRRGAGRAPCGFGCTAIAAARPAWIAGSSPGRSVIISGRLVLHQHAVDLSLRPFAPLASSCLFFVISIGRAHV